MNAEEHGGWRSSAVGLRNWYLNEPDPWRQMEALRRWREAFGMGYPPLDNEGLADFLDRKERRLQAGRPLNDDEDGDR